MCATTAADPVAIKWVKAGLLRAAVSCWFAGVSQRSCWFHGVRLLLLVDLGLAAPLCVLLLGCVLCFLWLFASVVGGVVDLGLVFL